MKSKGRKVTCQCCRQQEAYLCYQELEQGRPAFTTFGSHYRGFKVIAYICGSCAEKIRTGVIDISKG